MRALNDRFPPGTRFFEAVDSDGDERAYALVPVFDAAGKLLGARSVLPTGVRVASATWGCSEVSREAWLAKYLGNRPSA